ncbi:hypothetical protein BH20CHL8_BH20CHL8_07390 [soil metagenome]
MRSRLERLMTDAVQTERAVRPASTRAARPHRQLAVRAMAVARDRAVFESAALLLPVFLVAAPSARGWGLWAASAAYLAANAALVWRTSGHRAVRARGKRWNSIRIALSVALIASAQLLTSSTGLLAALYLPIVALAAFGGPVLLGFAVVASMGAHFGVEALDRASLGDAAQRALGFGAIILIVAMAMRREVRRMELARSRMRRADVTSEICVPLLADGQFLGFVNGEARAASLLESTDLRLMVAVADRLAAALIIGRDSQRLAERVELFRHLNGFSEAVNGTLQPDELYGAIVRSVSGVVRAEVTTLHIRDREAGRYLLRAADGADHSSVAEEATPGEGLAGRALRDRVMIIDEPVPRPRTPRPRTPRPGGTFLLDPREGSPMLGAALPLIRDGGVLGVLTLMRGDSSDGFSEPELDALRMLSEQAALAIANTFLHAELRELAMRDPLTGLFNRRYLDPALEQLIAQRARVPAGERFPLAAVMFDLDHFSELNNKHGHQVGDEVLRTFGAILRARMRASDLVARWGGEEFVAILFSATLEDAIRIADGVRRELAAAEISGADGGPLTATVSAGVAAVGPDADSAETLLRAADVALYMAKRAGRDRVSAA